MAYDRDSGMCASRLWWLLRWMGHDAVAVLDGGFAAWTADGHSTSSGVETTPAATFEERTASRDAGDSGGAAGVCRPRQVRGWWMPVPERFRGDIEPARSGWRDTFPGALNHFFQWNLAGGRFLAAEALGQRLRESIGDAEGDRIVCYCGSGVTACHNLLALEHAGISGARLYPGSWVNGRPIRRDPSSAAEEFPTRHNVRRLMRHVGSVRASWGYGQCTSVTANDRQRSLHPRQSSATIA